jgi:hypothetical protein
MYVVIMGIQVIKLVRCMRLYIVKFFSVGVNIWNHCSRVTIVMLISFSISVRSSVIVRIIVIMFRVRFFGNFT